jgi:hypothetical protein
MLVPIVRARKVNDASARYDIWYNGDPASIEATLAELGEAKAGRDRCRGHGSTHPRPCMNKSCTRV